jgi:hypothetical protein
VKLAETHNDECDVVVLQRSRQVRACVGNELLEYFAVL